VTLPQGNRRILLEPLGSRRLSSQTALDIRISRTFAFSHAGGAELMLDVLNALNDRAEEAIVSDNIASDTFGAPRLFIDPRRAMAKPRHPSLSSDRRKREWEDQPAVSVYLESLKWRCSRLRAS
jgi:hypothetical protein